MSAFSPRQMFLLDEACKPLAKAFDADVYLVGTAGVRGQAYRDVDIRLILWDDAYDRLADVHGEGGMAFLGIAIGEYLASRTGLPIDFQMQRMTEANANHPDGIRNPLGRRKLRSYRGDAVPLNHEKGGA